MELPRRVCIIHAYPNEYLINSLVASGASVVIVGNVEHFAKHPGVEAVLDVVLWDKQAVSNAVKEYHQRHPIDILLPVNEGTIFITALLSEELGLKSMSVHTAIASRNKFISYLIWEQVGVPVPKTCAIYNTESAWDLIQKEIGSKAVIKLVDSMNSQGVIAVDSHSSCMSAIETLSNMTEIHMATSPNLDRNRFAYGGSSLKLIAQEYCEGTEVSVELFLGAPKAGDCVLGILEKIASTGPYFAETASFTPTTLPPEIEVRVKEIAIRAARALGLKHGPAHVEIRLAGGEPKVLEAGLRPGGGYTAQLIEKLTGRNVYNLQLTQAMDIDSINELEGNSKAMLFGGVIYKKSGKLKEIHGVEIFENSKYVEQVVFLNKPGDDVKAMPESSQPHFCYYLLVGNSAEELISYHQNIYEKVVLTIE